LAAPRLDEQLCFALYSASSSITGVYRPLLAELNLTYPQFVVLMSLWEEDNVAIKRITERTHLNKATMTPLLKRLEEKGFIERTVLKSNEREKNISLTRSGKSLAAKGKAITEKVFCASGLSENQAETMIRLCHTINANTSV